MNKITMPLVSIIIPVYKAESHLRRCLDSVLNQTYGNWECICVNDGSPDNSVLILEEYSNRDQRIKFITIENSGVSFARNLAMKEVKGEYFLFIDSDDFIHPQTVELSVYQAVRDSSDIVIYKRSRSYTRRTKRLLSWGLPHVMPFFWKYRKESIASVRTENIHKYATDENKGRIEGVRSKYIVRHCSVCCSLYRSEVYRNIPFITGIRYEDVPWWGEALLRTRVATINNKNLYYYYPNFDSYTRKSSEARTRADNLEEALVYAEKVYENAGSDYQKMIWRTRFIEPLKRKLNSWRDML